MDATFPFSDNITSLGNTLEELEENVRKLRAMAKKYNSTLNEKKAVHKCGI